PRGRTPGTPLRAFWRALRRNRLALVGGAVVVCLVLLALLAPVIAPWDPNRPDIKKILDGPSNAHPLGTDQLGRDVLSRMLYGARVSLAVGFVSVGIASLIGVVLGSLAGYNGGLVDGATMRLVDLMLVFPRFFLLLAVLAFLRPSICTIMAVIGLTGWMGVARLVRAGFLSLSDRLAPHPAERDGARARGDDARHSGRDPHRIGPVVPRARRPAAARDLGQHPQRGQRRDRDRLVVVPVPRARDPRHRALVQPL